MSTRNPPPPQQPGSAFLAQREVLVKEIALAFENVLQNINKLNRSLEGVIAVGNEFGAVEALWSQFEGVMAQPGDEGGNAGRSERGSDEEGEGEGQERGREDGREGRRNGS